MSTREMKKILSDELQYGNELYEFCVQCINRIYGEDGEMMINYFNDDINFFDLNGCLQGLQSLDKYHQDIKKNRAEREMIRLKNEQEKQDNWEE